MFRGIVVVASVWATSYASSAECKDDECKVATSSLLQHEVRQGVKSGGGSDAELNYLLRETADCAARATGFVEEWGSAWTDFMELLVPSKSVMAQLLDVLTPLLTEGRMESLASMGIAQRTKPPCVQQGGATMLLETAQALDKSVSDQVSELNDNVASIHASSVELAKLAGSVSLLEQVMCPAFTDFIKHFHETIQAFADSLRSVHSLVQQNRPELLQLNGSDAQRVALKQLLQRTNDACEAESTAFIQYANDMVKYCQAMRGCTKTLALWSGLDQSTQECIDTFSKYGTNSSVLLCEREHA